ncbi:hypothetical protein SVIOM342S_09465 [Streptomyces violaceorubidus]
MPASPAAISTIAKPAHIHTYDPMIAGVTREGPSQFRPLYGSLKLSAGSLSSAPSAAAGSVKVPSPAAVVDAAASPSLTASIFIPA